jgi:hypothetical protein
VDKSDLVKTSDIRKTAMAQLVECWISLVGDRVRFPVPLVSWVGTIHIHSLLASLNVWYLLERVRPHGAVTIWGSYLAPVFSFASHVGVLTTSLCLNYSRKRLDFET